MSEKVLDVEWTDLIMEAERAYLAVEGVFVVDHLGMQAALAAILAKLEVREVEAVLERVCELKVSLPAGEVTEDDLGAKTIVLGGEETYEVDPPSDVAVLKPRKEAA